MMMVLFENLDLILIALAHGISYRQSLLTSFLSPAAFVITLLLF